MKKEDRLTREQICSSPMILVALLLIQALAAVPGVSAEPNAPPSAKHAERAAAKGPPEPGSSSTTVLRAPQNVRLFIASLLERLPRLRKHDDDGAPKLVKAEIAGPVESKPLFRANAATLYCTQFDLIFTDHVLWNDHAVLNANVAFAAPDDGKQKVLVRVTDIFSRSKDCKGAPFKPFPELEQLRDRRRRELGKADK